MTQAGRKVRISYKSEILGNGVSWEGYPYIEANTIKNKPSRSIAIATAKDGKARQCGMWYTEVIKK